MRLTSVLAAAAVAAAGSVGIFGAPVAAADDVTTTTLGNEARLTNDGVVQGWTVSNLKTSTDSIPYPVAGTLWDATATDAALEGSVTPIVSNLNARTKSGETYRVLYGVATPQGVNPATLAQGEKTSGKIYFDVVGDSPDSVVYNAGGDDLLVWISAPPQLPRAYPSQPAPSSGASTTPAPAAAGTPGAPAAADGTLPPAAVGGPATKSAPGAPLPTSSQGTPIPAGSQGTPIAPEGQGAPAPAATPTAAPAAGAAAPAATRSEGTPLPASAAPVTTPVMPPA